MLNQEGLESIPNESIIRPTNQKENTKSKQFHKLQSNKLLGNENESRDGSQEHGLNEKNCIDCTEHLPEAQSTETCLDFEDLPTSTTEISHEVEIVNTPITKDEPSSTGNLLNSNKQDKESVSDGELTCKSSQVPDLLMNLTKNLSNGQFNINLDTSKQQSTEELDGLSAKQNNSTLKRQHSVEIKEPMTKKVKEDISDADPIPSDQHNQGENGKI